MVRNMSRWYTYYNRKQMIDILTVRVGTGVCCSSRGERTHTWVTTRQTKKQQHFSHHCSLLRTHGKIHGTFVLQDKVFIFKLFAINGLATSSVALRKVTCKEGCIESFCQVQDSRNDTSTWNAQAKTDVPPWIIKLGTINIMMQQCC